MLQAFVSRIIFSLYRKAFWFNLSEDLIHYHNLVKELSGTLNNTQRTNPVCFCYRYCCKRTYQTLQAGFVKCHIWQTGFQLLLSKHLHIHVLLFQKGLYQHHCITFIIRMAREMNACGQGEHGNLIHGL